MPNSSQKIDIGNIVNIFKFLFNKSSIYFFNLTTFPIKAVDVIYMFLLCTGQYRAVKDSASVNRNHSTISVPSKKSPGGPDCASFSTHISSNC